MKNLTVILITLLASTPAFAQTQAEMNQTASNAYKQADAELNQVYQQILSAYSDDEVFLQALKESQRNWIKFRDSEVKMKYPPREPGWYGSIHGMCISYYKADLTNQRTTKLKEWLQSEEEGDACAGSVRSN